MLFYSVHHQVKYSIEFENIYSKFSDTHNLIKDMILMSAVFISFGACLYAFLRHRKTQESMKIMLKELETLQKAEGDLIAVTGK